MDRLAKNNNKITQINKIRYKREVIIDTREIQRVYKRTVKDYIPPNSITQKKMDKFLEICNLSRLNHKIKGNLNRLINNEKIGTTIKTCQKVKVQDHLASLLNSNKYSNKT